MPGPRISVGEQLTQVLEECRAIRAMLDQLIEDADTEPLSSEEECSDEEEED